MDEHRCEQDSASEAHQTGHKVLHPFHSLLLDELDEEQRTEAGAKFDEPEQDQDDDFGADKIHFSSSFQKWVELLR